MLVVSPTFADPDSPVKWLMNDPVSMFDWGIQSLDQDLSEHLIDRPESKWRRLWRITAEYDYLTDRLYIVSRMDFDNMSDEQFRAWCEATFSRLRALLRIDGNGVATAYDEHFSHKGFQRADRPDDLAERLSAITVLIARGDEGRTAHICEAALSRESISYRTEEDAGP
jgi:hypothetical protein